MKGDEEDSAQGSEREKGREMEEGVADGGKKVSKKLNPYLGRPSSGAQDLKGRQEHSQHRERDNGKVFLSH